MIHQGIYIADKNNQRIRKVSIAGIISTIGGTGVGGYSGDGGLGISAEINAPFDIVTDNSGNVIFADFNNQVIRKINTTGIISTIAGNHTVGYSGDGGIATATSLSYPDGIAVDIAGNIFISDAGNNLVRKINSSGIISTLAGTTTPAYTSDGGPAIAASINYPGGLAVDGAGNLYFADKNNYVIRKINTSGIITTIVGNGIYAYGGDCGPATSAEIAPSGVRMNTSDNLFIADNLNMVVRKISAPMGIITGSSNVCIGTPVTLSDTSSGGSWGSGSTGIAIIGSGTGIVTGVTAGIDTITYTFSTGCTASKAITVNPSPNAGSISGIDSVCVGYSDTLHDSILGGIWSSASGVATVSSSGVVTGISSGWGSISYSVTNVCGTASSLFSIHVVDSSLCSTTGVEVVNSSLFGFKIYPNPNAGVFIISLSPGIEEKALITVKNLLGQKVLEFVAVANKQIEINGGLLPGIYFVSAATEHGRYMAKIVVGGSGLFSYSVKCCVKINSRHYYGDFFISLPFASFHY